MIFSFAVDELMVRTIHVFMQFIDESRERQRETEAILPVSHHRRSSGASVGTLNAFKVKSIVLYEQKSNCYMMLHNSVNLSISALPIYQTR